ncbi:MAG: ABC transporter permease [Candidatus Hermodarchaeia archaeon]|jgi:lipopolysaccharide transport system permease protein
MWQYRELIRNLTFADLKNRYQNTALGFFWSLLSPFLLAMVLYFVFSHLFGREGNFAINLLVGIMAWRFFATGTSSSLLAIVSKASLVTRVYIPRQILVLSNTLANIISSLLEFIILLPIIFALLGYLPVTVLLFPVVHIVYFFFIYGAGLFLSSLFVYFRDVNQIWQVLIQVLFFCSPIIYPLSTVPEYLMPYYVLNPVTQFIITYRDVMVAGNLPSLHSIVVVIGFAVASYLVGSYVFSKLQRRFAEEMG